VEVAKMRAKYDGKCTECGGGVYVGDEVRFNGRGRGVRHADTATCDELAEMAAEQAAEMRFELGTQAHMMGLGYLVREYGFDSL
jgi:hypothetical protein